MAEETFVTQAQKIREEQKSLFRNSSNGQNNAEKMLEFNEANRSVKSIQAKGSLCLYTMYNVLGWDSISQFDQFVQKTQMAITENSVSYREEYKQVVKSSFNPEPEAKKKIFGLF